MFWGPRWRDVDEVVFLKVVVCVVILIAVGVFFIGHLVGECVWLRLTPRADDRVALPGWFTHLVVLLEFEGQPVLVTVGGQGWWLLLLLTLVLGRQGSINRRLTDLFHVMGSFLANPSHLTWQ